MTSLSTRIKPYYNPMPAGVKLPVISLTEEQRKSVKARESLSNFEVLRRLCFQGVQRLGIDKFPNKQVYYDRLSMELATFDELGFIDYVLLNWDILNFCHENNIPVGLGRGCLNYEAPILTDNGYKNLGEIKVGDKVVNRFGDLDTVTHFWEHYCNEDLVSFYCGGPTYSNIRMTLDHKVLSVKNPFKLAGRAGIKSFNKLHLPHFLNEESMQWTCANDVSINDYLCRFIGRSSPIIDIEYLDLSIYSDRYDDNFVYEGIKTSNQNPLSIKSIFKNTGISESALRRMKSICSSQIEKHSLYPILLKYLLDRGYSFKDFAQYSPIIIRKFNRRLKVNEDLMYLVGFFLGDGWVRKNNRPEFGLAFNSEVDQDKIERISKYFDSLGVEYKLFPHKKTKLLQMIVKSRIFSKLMKFISKGKLACEKKIPVEFLNLPDSKIRSILNGLLDSDDHITKNGVINFDSTSQELAYQVRNLLEYFGHVCSISQRDQVNCNRSYKVKCRTLDRQKTSRFFNDGKFIYTKVIDKTIAPNKTGKVYDIAVKNDPSYNTDKMIVHNSAPSSLVLYVIGVTGIDPIKYGLFFERFVSKTRARKILGDDGETYLDGSLLADVDNDISYDRREEVIQYINKKYSGKTSKILTLNTLSGKLCIKECGKIVAEMSESEVNTVSDTIPKKFGKVADLIDAYDQSPFFRSFADKNPRVYEIAKKLEGLNKNTGVHPSGIAISAFELEDIMPTQSTKEGSLISGYDMHGVSELMVKFDILGLRTLSVVNDVCKQLGIAMNDIDINHPSIYAALQELRAPSGLFQIEADTNFRVAQKVKPRSLEQLAAVVSIARPGALDFTDRYAEYVRTGESQIIHPFFEDVLNYTGGVVLYQEQLMQMAVKIGFSLEEAEILRRIVGKKKVEDIPVWKEKISHKIQENSLDPQIGDILWKVAEDSANYSFNLSHACSYAYLAAITIYLKFNHPQEFFLSLLKYAQFEPTPHEEIYKITQELAQFDIKLLPPDLGKSDIDFKIEGKNIRYGLNTIKGVSTKVIECLLEFREKEFLNKYDVFSAAKQAGVNIGVLSSLIQAGILDTWVEKDRCRLVLESQSFNILTDREKRLFTELGQKFNFDILESIKSVIQDKMKGDDNKLIMSDKRYATFKSKYEPYKEIYEKNHRHIKFANWHFETKLLGYSYSYNVRQIFSDEIGGEPLNSEQISEIESNQTVRFVGTVGEIISRTSKNDNKYARFDLNDERGKITALFMDSSRDERYTKFLKNGGVLPKKGDVAIIIGKKFNDAIMIDKLTTLEDKIFMKLSELK